MKTTDTPLRVVIKNNKLIIEIGLDTLKYAAEHCPRFYEYDKHIESGPPYCEVIDKMELAHDMVRALLYEKEDGSTPISDLIDECFVAAWGDGSLAFKDEE